MPSTLPYQSSIASRFAVVNPKWCSVGRTISRLAEASDIALSDSPNEFLCGTNAIHDRPLQLEKLIFTCGAMARFAETIALVRSRAYGHGVACSLRIRATSSMTLVSSRQ